MMSVGVEMTSYLKERLVSVERNKIQAAVEKGSTRNHDGRFGWRHHHKR